MFLAPIALFTNAIGARNMSFSQIKNEILKVV